MSKSNQGKNLDSVNLSPEEESAATEGIVGETADQAGAESVPAPKAEKAKVKKVDLKSAKKAVALENLLHNGVHLSRGKEVALKHVTQAMVDENLVELS